MFYWSIWSLVSLLPYLLGWWKDRGSLLYIAGALFVLLMILCYVSGGSRGVARQRTLARVLLFVFVNGILVLFVNPWILGLVYASFVIFYLLKPGLFERNPQLERRHGAQGSTRAADSIGSGVSDRARFRGGVG